MKNHISVQRIFQQIKADAIGKDSHRGITLTYAWLANQFGHISLGFIPSFLVYQFSKISAFKSALYVSLFWFCFELYNFLGPLLLKKESKSDAVYIPKKTSYKFKPKWLNVAFDTFTDVCFFVFGATLFYLSMNGFDNKAINIFLVCLLVYLLIAGRYWFITKMYQFYARFPFQFRLSQWDFTINKNQKEIVDQFLASKDLGNHLLIYGNLNTGKTSLGVGILNELSIKNYACLYVNAIKLYNYFFKDENDVLEAHEIWDWRGAEFLMIDDINPTDPIKEELIKPDKLLSFIDNFGKVNCNNRNTLKNKNVIWVLGNRNNSQEKPIDNWKQMLISMNVDKAKISTINL